MLVCSRKRNEGFVLVNVLTGERIEMLMTDVRGAERCRVGITAGQDWRILRWPEHFDENKNPLPHFMKEGKANDQADQQN